MINGTEKSDPYLNWLPEIAGAAAGSLAFSTWGAVSGVSMAAGIFALAKTAGVYFAYQNENELPRAPQKLNATYNKLRNCISETAEKRHRIIEFIKTGRMQDRPYAITALKKVNEKIITLCEECADLVNDCDQLSNQDPEHSALRFYNHNDNLGKIRLTVSNILKGLMTCPFAEVSAPLFFEPTPLTTYLEKQQQKPGK